MVRAFIYSLVALGIGAGLYILLGDDPGFVLISFGTWTVETTLVAMVLLLLVVFALFYGIYRFLLLINPVGLLRGNSWLGGRLRKNAAMASENGLHKLLLGHWQDAYKLLVENADRVDNPMFNYLAASLAAWQRGDDASWNYCLEQAGIKARNPSHGIKTLKALLEYRSGKVEQSLAILLALDKEVPGSPYVLGLLNTIYQSVEDWEKLEAMLPAMEKAKVISSEDLALLKEKIIASSLQKITEQSGGQAVLMRKWNDANKKIRGSESATLVYIEKLLEFSRHDEAMAVAVSFLKSRWSDQLVLLAGYIDPSDPGQQLMHFEKWLKSRPNNSTLMLSLGRACLRNRLWGKAREYFKNALRFSKSMAVSAEANAELARLLDHMGEHAQSAALYGKAIAQLNHKLPELPMPD